MTIRFLLDTNILSEVIRNPSGRAATRMRALAEDVGTSIIVAAELRFGIAKRSTPVLAQRVDQMLRTILVLPFETPADAAYGEVRADLERRGSSIGANDLFIAAQALALGLTLVTDNEREFARVPGLKLENWLV